MNIEISLFTDVRFRRLVVEVGGNDAYATGLLIQFWFLAQRHWFKGRSSIPEEEFNLLDGQPLIKCLWAKKTESGIYACGAQDAFGWYDDLNGSKSKAGKASVKARKNKFGTAQPRLVGATKEKTCSTNRLSVRGFVRGDLASKLEHTRTESNALTLTLTPTLIEEEEASSATGYYEQNLRNPEQEEPLPPTLTNPEIKSLCVRRKFSARGLRAWLSLVGGDAEFLRRALILWDSQADSGPPEYTSRPAVTRFSQFLDKRLEKKPKAKKTQVFDFTKLKPTVVTTE